MTRVLWAVEVLGASGGRTENASYFYLGLRKIPGKKRRITDKMTRVLRVVKNSGASGKRMQQVLQARETAVDAFAFIFQTAFS